MFDYKLARKTMLESQIRTNDVTDKRIHEAFLSVPRECFVPKSKQALSYSDRHIEIGEERFMLRPRDFAKMLEAADIKSEDIVLSIGAGRGYEIAVLSQLAETVIAVEQDANLAAKSTELLDNCGTSNSAVIVSDMRAGTPEHGPFDLIFVTGAISEIPKTWIQQLTDNGRIVACITDGHIGRVKVFHKSGDSLGEKTVFDANVPVLPGFARKLAFAL